VRHFWQISFAAMEYDAPNCHFQRDHLWVTRENFAVSTAFTERQWINSLN